jgi:hypothetical protein
MKLANALCAVLFFACTAPGRPAWTSSCEVEPPPLPESGAVFRLEPSRTRGGCTAGDPSAEARFVVESPFDSDLVVRAESSAGPLVLTLGDGCGDPSPSACVLGEAGEQAALVVQPGQRSVLTVRSRTGEATDASLTRFERKLAFPGESCDAPSDCLPTDACDATRRCMAGSRCLLGICSTDGLVPLGGPCNERQLCSVDGACIDQECVSAQGQPCDAEPWHCSPISGLACLDDVCQTRFALAGERCTEARPCAPLFRCVSDGGPPNGICVDVLGLDCQSDAPLALASNQTTTVTIPTLEGASRAADACGMGERTPERVLMVTTDDPSQMWEIIDASPGLSYYVRGPSACGAAAETACAGERNVRRSGWDTYFVIVEAGGGTLSFRTRAQTFYGGPCAEDVCDSGLTCVNGECRAPVPLFCCASVPLEGDGAVFDGSLGPTATFTAGFGEPATLRVSGSAEAAILRVGTASTDCSALCSAPSSSARMTIPLSGTIDLSVDVESSELIVLDSQSLPARLVFMAEPRRSP